jgi:hypothetical protein
MISELFIFQRNYAILQSNGQMFCWEEDLMNSKYKYNPDDFNGILGLSDDLGAFYQLYEVYRNENTQDNWFALRKHWEDLFFTIKHREVEGFLNPLEAQEIRTYLEELANA